MSQEPNPYLRDAVLTAGPEQLQLMLYDGAIRFTRQGIKGIEEQKWEQCFEGFNRAQRIVLELLNGLNYDVDRELCTRTAGIYNFIYRKLVEACTQRELLPANDALGLLEFQRETWFMRMEKLRRERADGTKSQAARAEQADSHDENLAGAGYGTLCFEG